MLRLANGAACILQAAELAGDGHRDHLQRVAGSGALLVLTSSRLEALGRTLPAEFCGASLPAHNLDHTGIGHLAIDPPTSGLMSASANLVGERRGSLADYATRLLRIAKLLPAVLLARLPSRDAGKLQRICDEHNIMLI